MKETLQELFDKVVRHFAIQVVPAVNSMGGCQYRMRAWELPKKFASFLPLHLQNPNDTLECAAGCLISDEEYRSSFENRSACGLIADGKVSLTSGVSDLVQELQNVHDTASNAGQVLTSPEVGAQLKRVAEQFELNASRVTW